MLQVDETKIDSTFETSNEMPSIMNGNKSSLVSVKIFLNFASCDDYFKSFLFCSLCLRYQM